MYVFDTHIVFCYQEDKDTCICIARLFVSSLSFQTPAAAEKRLWAACAWLKQVLTGCWKRASRHIWCAVHSQHYLRLALPSIIGHHFFHETLSSVYCCFLYEMAIFALRCGLRGTIPEWWAEVSRPNGLGLPCGFIALYRWITVLKNDCPQRSPFLGWGKRAADLKHAVLSRLAILGKKWPTLRR